MTDPAPTPRQAVEPPHQHAPALRYRPWLHRYSLLLVAATLLLIGIGGNVTSLDAGMAVPDGFTSFGHFVLTTPLEKWWYDLGTRWEHGHRIMGTLVGLLTIGLTVWLGLTQRARPWLRWTGVGLLGLVIVQGVMGALRVEESSLFLAFVHGIVGQLFLGMTVLTAAATGPTWLRLRARAEARGDDRPDPTSRSLRYVAVALLAVLVVQLTLGAAVRHMKADRAIPDFPLAYGMLVPPMSQAAIDETIAALPEVQAAAAASPGRLQPNRNAAGEPLVSAGEVHIHFTHRVWALVVTGVIGAAVVMALRRASDFMVVFGPSVQLVALLVIQISLGAMVIWSQSLPSFATLHQVVGAAILAVATLLAIRIHLLARSGGFTADRAEQRKVAGAAPAMEGQPA